ncbi:MAG: hypothetical protein HZB59_01850 [Ignavibacteriales bacterium]|nr:hypothetical protein [Ignavibacteriales bacterium]
MKSFLANILIIILLISSIVLLFNGCELFTRPNGSTDRKPVYGQDLIISEVCTVPPDRYYAYSWIEIMNPTRRAINWIETSQPATAFMVGDNGTIWKTTNNGNSWLQLPTSTINNLNSISFPGIDVGIVVGDQGKILKLLVTDTSSQVQDISEAHSVVTGGKNLNDVEMYWNNTTGYIVGDNGLILRTNDRGNTWAKYQTTTVPYNLRSVTIKGFSLTWAVGDSGTILKSTAQKVWVPKTPPDLFLKANFKSCTFIRDTGWVVGENGAIAYTKTAGNIFSEQFPPAGLEHANFNYVFFGAGLGDAPNRYTYNIQEGFIIGDSGVILRTKNYGELWERIDSRTTENLHFMHFVDSLRGWIVGAKGTLLITFDGGFEWFPLKIGNANLYAGHFSPALFTLQSVYGLEIKGKRKEYYYDPVTNTTNYNVFVKVDTGYLYFNPAQLATRGVEIRPISAGGFCIINNDSVRFANHTKLGPGPYTKINASVNVFFDPTSPDTIRRVLWDLLSEGEIRLVKYDVEYYDPPGTSDDRFTRFDKKVIDVVRWGNFQIKDSVSYANELYQVWPQNSIYVSVPYPGTNTMAWNISAPAIPEGYSLSRYADDYGKIETEINSSNSFYLAEKPLPGWVSQRSKK